jgi:hypothetical protein
MTASSRNFSRLQLATLLSITIMAQTALAQTIPPPAPIPDLQPPKPPGAVPLAAVPATDPLAAQFKLGNRKLGRVSFQSVTDGRMVTVTSLGAGGRVLLTTAHDGDDSQAFQWTEMPRGDLLFLSLAIARHLRIKPDDGTITADEPGAQSDRQNGASFHWHDVVPQ